MRQFDEAAEMAKATMRAHPVVDGADEAGVIRPGVAGIIRQKRRRLVWPAVAGMDAEMCHRPEMGECDCIAIVQGCTGSVRPCQAGDQRRLSAFDWLRATPTRISSPAIRKLPGRGSERMIAPRTMAQTGTM